MRRTPQARSRWPAPAPPSLPRYDPSGRAPRRVHGRSLEQREVPVSAHCERVRELIGRRRLVICLRWPSLCRAQGLSRSCEWRESALCHGFVEIAIIREDGSVEHCSAYWSQVGRVRYGSNLPFLAERVKAWKRGG